MSWRREAFRAAYRREGTIATSNRYVAYLNKVDAIVGDLDDVIARDGALALEQRVADLPADVFGGQVARRNCVSALRRYLRWLPTGDERRAGNRPANAPVPRAIALDPMATDHEIRQLLAAIRPLAGRYRALTGKPLGVTGEVAEMAAADALGLKLCAARTAGHDALDLRTSPARRVQIRGRAVDRADRYRGPCPSIVCGGRFDDVLLVLLDRTDLSLLEVWQATESPVIEKLAPPGSRARNERHSLAITQFKAIGRRVWPVQPEKAVA